MSAPGRPTMSVIVVTHNEREMVEHGLPPLVEQLEEGDELIVADNASSDGSADSVRRRDSRTRSGGRRLTDAAGRRGWAS